MTTITLSQLYRLKPEVSSERRGRGSTLAGVENTLDFSSSLHGKCSLRSQPQD